MTLRRRLLLSLALGSALFSIHNAGVLSGALNPPPGYEPAWTPRNLDVAQYLTWIEAARTRILLPDFHAPWTTAPALFQPLMLAASRTHLPLLAAYSLMNFAGYLVAAFALFTAAEVFCPGIETWFALLAALCAVPLRLFLQLPGGLLPTVKTFGILGMIDYAYNSADGLFRGGMSNSATLSVGTATVLFAMAALGRFVETGERRYLARLALMTFLSAILHPFEVAVIVAAAAVPLFRRGNAVGWLAVVLSAVAGLAPYLALSLRVRWLRDVGEVIQYPIYPFWIVAEFGFPFLLLAYLLMIRFRLPQRRDGVLQSWFLATCIVPFLPGAPFAIHLFDGFAYCVGFLLVRRLSQDRQLLPLLARRRFAAYSSMAAAASLTAAALALLYIQIWRDGRRADPEALLSAVRPVSERQLLERLRQSSPRDALVLSPPGLSPWIATIPRVSFASHDFSSITYNRQSDLAARFYKGEDLKRDLLDAYGVRFVVIPRDSLALRGMRAANWRFDAGPYRIYEFPDARMKPYPGLKALQPDRPRSLRTKILDWLAHAGPAHT